jgi:hypothetical protein
MDIDSPSKLATEEPEMGGNVVDEASDLHLDLAPSPEPSSTSPLHRVTVEDVDDEEDNFISVEPCQLSPKAMAEEGLDELPWDPFLPWQIDSPATPASEPANPARPTAPVHVHNTPASSSTVLFRSIRVRFGIFDTIKIRKKSDKLRKNYCRNRKKVGVTRDNELIEIV